MEAFFDNNSNIVNARICASLDSAPLYTLETAFAAFKGRVRTVIRDANPLPGAKGANPAVGAINWGEKSIEVGGMKRAIKEVRRVEGGLFNKKKYWRWGPARKEYTLAHSHEEWKATLVPASSQPTSASESTATSESTTDADSSEPAAHFFTPSRPHLFTKPAPPRLRLSSAALAEDEVFLILVLVYEEVRRQDRTNTSTPNGTL
ncbi:hypothetical protein FB451DRAFT_1121780 [Mycena latifolia]|nr:hypothetical protein FB451DRAFT_1121780 [Mycena latifolia]